MMAAEKDSASAPAEALLENPNSRLVIVRQILCILVPLAVWFSPLPLEQFAAYVKEQTTWWTTEIKAAGIEPE